MYILRNKHNLYETDSKELHEYYLFLHELNTSWVQHYTLATKDLISDIFTSIPYIVTQVFIIYVIRCYRSPSLSF